MIPAIDNFKVIQGVIDEEPKTSDKFYFVQIIMRKGMNMNFNSSNRTRTIKSYYIPSTANLENYKKEIQFLCDATGARAYINLNARSFKRSALKSTMLTAQALDYGHEALIHTTYNKALMDTPIVGKKFWIMDFDFKDYESENAYHLDMVKFLIIYPQGMMCNIIRSKAGHHILIDPFRRDTLLTEMQEKGLKAELKIDASTNLYIPKDDTLLNSDELNINLI